MLSEAVRTKFSQRSRSIPTATPAARAIPHRPIALIYVVPQSSSRKPLLRLLLLTAIALLILGYHPYAEDAEIYLPGVEKILHPNFFPVGREFFAAHASMTLFPNLIAFSIRATHLPMEICTFRLAGSIDFSAASRLLGSGQPVFSKFARALGCSLSDCRPANPASRRNRALHRRPIS